MRTANEKSRPSSTSWMGGMGVFVVGLAVTAGFYAGLKTLFPTGSLVVRYLSGHPVSYAETWMFLWGMLIVLAKLSGILRERMALRRNVLPQWSGEPVAVQTAESLLAGMGKLSSGVQKSLVGMRVREALEFVHGRKSTDGFDDYLTNQSVASAEKVEGSYSLIRFITWAIPILGFLGTVFGINEALGNVTPEKLANSIAGVTDGLAVAFDTTAIALMYSILLMFGTFLAERFEQGLLRSVDGEIERELLNRFERTAEEKDDPAQRALFRAVEGLVQKQAEIWSRTMEDMRSRHEAAEKQQVERMAAALNKAFENTLTSYQKRLHAMEGQLREELIQQTAEGDKIKVALAATATCLERQSHAVAEQTAAIMRLHENENQLLRIQEMLQQNLQTLANVGSFQEAVHSLAAAIHLLTARVEARPMPTTPAKAGAIWAGGKAA
jgi:biopolymer transport protein ExbB/TolQ/predicted secreted protein